MQQQILQFQSCSSVCCAFLKSLVIVIVVFNDKYRNCNASVLCRMIFDSLQLRRLSFFLG